MINLFPKNNRWLRQGAFSLVAFLWCYAIYIHQQLPSRIPVHFALNGEPDRMGSRDTIWILCGIATMLFVLLTLISQYPQSFNYPAKITQDNKVYQHQLAVQLMCRLNISILLVFIFCLIEIKIAAKKKSLPFHGWELQLILALVFLPTILYLVKSLRNRQ
ncbi:MAG: hypothetical protein JWQ27_2241 [Ferruginibacter sp.]|nr:hypothetical protein [Ferruginibacter sp.]